MDAYLKKKKFAYLWPPRLKILRSSLHVDDGFWLFFTLRAHRIQINPPCIQANINSETVVKTLPKKKMDSWINSLSISTDL